MNLDKKKRILFVSHLYPSSLEPRRAPFNRQLVAALERSCDIKVVAPYFWCPGKRVLPDRESLDGVDLIHPRIFYVPGLLVHKHWKLYSFFARKQLQRMISEFKPDHIVIGFLYPDAVAVAPLCRELGVEYSLRVNGSDFYLRSGQNKFREMVLNELRKAPKIFCPGEALKDAMAAEGVDAEKIVAFDNGVDGELFKFRKKENAISCLGIADLSSVALAEEEATAGRRLDERRSKHIRDRKKVLFVGNLVDVKGADLLLEAFALMSSKGVPGQNAVLLLIGDGPMRRRLERMAEKLGVGGRVFFLGSRPHDEVALWMNCADCLSLPSRSEGMPNVVLEALSSGMPVVAADVGECRNILKEERCAKVVPSEDAGALANALEEVLGMDVERAAMAERYKGKYSWNRAADTVLETL